MEKRLKDWKFREHVDYLYGQLIMSLVSANKPRLVMRNTMDTAIRWRKEQDEVKK